MIVDHGLMVATSNTLSAIRRMKGSMMGERKGKDSVSFHNRMYHGGIDLFA